jgi:hypothetical protein
MVVGVALLATLVVDTVQAQEKGRGQGRRGRGPEDAVSLAANEQVQKELAVTDEQRAEIVKIAAAHRNEMSDLSSGQEGLSREERAKKRAEQTPQRDEISKKYEAKLAEALKEDQFKRLKEITIQHLGARALLRADVATELKLADDQKQKIQQIVDSQSDRMRKLFADAGAGGNREEAMKKFAEMRKEIEAEAVAVLNDEQKKQFESMKGEKFELQQGERRNRDA